MVEVRWPGAHATLSAIRRRVFVEEQGVPEALEWDGLDAGARHFLAVTADGSAIGCARLLADGRIGRMAVLPAWRRRGVGSALPRAAVDACRLRGDARVRLSAQLAAIPFYARAGFAVCGPVHADAGIPHRDMLLTLSA